MGDAHAAASLQSANSSPRAIPLSKAYCRGLNNFQCHFEVYLGYLPQIYMESRPNMSVTLSASTL